MATAFLVGIHVVICIFLILIVLLQSGKGAAVGASFGAGASQTLFGASGPATILTKITTAVAVIFMITSLTLAWMSRTQYGSSIMTGTPAPMEQKTE